MQSKMYIFQLYCTLILLQEVPTSIQNESNVTAFNSNFKYSDLSHYISLIFLSEITTTTKRNLVEIKQQNLLLNRSSKKRVKRQLTLGEPIGEMILKMGVPFKPIFDKEKEENLNNVSKKPEKEEKQRAISRKSSKMDKEKITTEEGQDEKHSELIKRAASSVPDNRFKEMLLNINNSPKGIEMLEMSLASSYKQKVDPKTAHIMAKGVKILCAVVTYPDNHKTKAWHVKKTWGKRCTKLIFMSTENDAPLQAVKLNDTQSGYYFLWSRTKSAFKYVYKHHLNDFDWFLKADDDTYIVVEHLKRLLVEYNTDDPLFFGLRFMEGRQGYMNGGAGYVLSREALHLFVKTGLTSKTKCIYGEGTNEDISISTCLQSIGVKAIDTRDSKGRERFYIDPPERIMFGDNSQSFRKKGVFHHEGSIGNGFHAGLPFRRSEPMPLSIDTKRPHLHFQSNRGLLQPWPLYYGPNSCSDVAISFHHLSAKDMYNMDYLIYRLNPHGNS